jgi:hypothetical protein
MRPDPGIIPLGHAPGTRPRRERTEAWIIVPFCEEPTVPPHCPGAGVFRPSGRNAMAARQQLSERNGDTKGLLPRSAWRHG